MDNIDKIADTLAQDVLDGTRTYREAKEILDACKPFTPAQIERANGNAWLK